MNNLAVDELIRENTVMKAKFNEQIERKTLLAEDLYLRIRKQQRRIEALRRDKLRLDWLDGLTKERFEQVMSGWLVFPQNLRDEIDILMKEQQ